MKLQLEQQQSYILFSSSIRSDETRKTYTLLLKKFIDDLNSKYTVNFENPFCIAGQKTLYQLFKEQCRTCFGKEGFDAYFGSLNKCTDYTKMEDLVEIIHSAICSKTNLNYKTHDR